MAPDKNKEKLAMTGSTKPRGKVILSRTRAFVVFDKILDLYKRGAYPYTLPAAELPQNRIPDELKEDKLAHARFLFYVCHHMRGMVRSITAFEQHLKMREEHPWMYVPEEASARSEEEILAALDGYLRVGAKVTARFWKENSERLQWWGGDPRNLFDGVRNFKTLTDRVCNKKKLVNGFHMNGFLGFQEKMASMLAYFLAEAELVPTFSFPPPIDFHHMRMAMATGVIRKHKSYKKTLRYTEDVVKPVRDVSAAYCRERGEDSILFANALWLYSLILCAQSPINSDENEDNDHNKNKRDHGMFTELPRNRVLPRAKWWGRYMASCGSCPMQTECSFGIPARPYYLKGMLIPRPRPEIRQEFTLAGPVEIPEPVQGKLELE